jgi:hypothetical protein
MTYCFTASSEKPIFHPIRTQLFCERTGSPQPSVDAQRRIHLHVQAA